MRYAAGCYCLNDYFTPRINQTLTWSLEPRGIQNVYTKHTMQCAWCRHGTPNPDMLSLHHCTFVLKVLVNFTTTDGEQVSNATLYNSLDTFELQGDKLHVSRRFSRRLGPFNIHDIWDSRNKSFLHVSHHIV